MSTPNDAERFQPAPEQAEAPSLDDTQPTRTAISLPYNRCWRWWTAAVFALLVVVTGVTLFLLLDETDTGEAVVVMVQIDNETYPVTTEARTVEALLAEQNLTIEAGDILTPGGDTEITAGMLIWLDRARTISVTVDGLTSVLRTTLDSPLEILNLAGQTTHPADKVVVNGMEITAEDLATWSHPVTTLVIRRAVEVQIVDGDTVWTLQTTGETVGDVLVEAGVELFLADTVIPDLGTPVENGLQIAIDRSQPLTIIADGTRTEMRVKGTTIADALAEVGVVLSGLDYTIPDETTAILPGMSVRVIRVTEDISTELELIPYQTVYQADNTLGLDRRSVLQVGQNGTLERTIRVRYENGIEVSRNVEQEIVIRQPQSQIVGYGTQIVIRTLETPEGPLQYWRRLRMYATSYYPAELGGNTTTSIGYHLEKGIVGIDPRIIPYRTNIYVEGYGPGVAADTGGPRSTPYWIDLGYSDEDWVSWSQWVDVYLLLPVPETVNYLLPENERGGPIP